MSDPQDNQIPQGAQAVTIVRQPKPPIVGGAPIRGIIPHDYDEAARMAKAVYLSGTYPDTFKSSDESVTVARVCGAILRGAEIGIPPYYALAHIIIVNNRYSIDGETAVAVAQSNGLLADIKIEVLGKEPEDDWGCRYTAYRRSPEGLKPYVGEFTVRMAKRAKLWLAKDNWIKYPERMLLARARAYALREGFADCLAGIAITEEQQDIAPPPGPADTSFLSEEPPLAIEGRAEASNQPTGSDSPISGVQTATPEEPPLQRGLRLLATIKTKDVLGDLRASVGEELRELANMADAAAWETACDVRKKEMKA